jgi:hypothetical protein
MRQFPLQIEADLLLRGIDVFDWHQGRMSSRRLITLIGVLENDPDSSLAREWRDGDWSDREYLMAASVNELRRLRADQAAIHAQHEMDVDLVKSPSQQGEHEKFVQKHHDVRAHLMSQLKGEVKPEFRKGTIKPEWEEIKPERTTEYN